MADSDITSRLAPALEGRYAIERELGAGGMATVFLARDLRHERQVAIKVLREDLSASLGKDRFLREIKIAAALQHPHVLPLYDSGEAGGLLYYVMPFVDGQSLRDRLASGALAVSEAMRILRDIADALGEAHRHGIVHRDLKPENVMISGRHALVMDFGVAKAVSEAKGSATLTTVGIAIGTPAYMSPEQATGDPNVDHRADIYAFGVVAYELLAGSQPFSGSPQQVLAAHVTKPADPITNQRSSLPASLASLVMRCLEKQPEDRVQSADELVRTLEEATTPSGATAPTGARAATAAGRRRSMARVAAVAAVVIAALLWGMTKFSSLETASDGAVTAQAPSVGVLPFVEKSAPPGQEYFADGLTEEVIIALSAIPGLRVPGRESSLRFKGSTAPRSVIADSLDVAMLLSASVERAGGEVRVRYDLTNATDGVTVLGGNITRPANDVFAIYDSVARVISGKLSSQLGGGIAASTTRRQVDFKAYEAYLQGKVHLSNRRIDSAITYLQRSLVIDSTSAETWAALGFAAALAGPSDYAVLPPADAMALSRAAVRRAVALDSTSADVWAAASMLATHELRWDDATDAYERALRINPAHAPALQSAATQLGAFWKTAESYDKILAAERADPLAFIAGTWRAWLASHAGRRDEALRQIDRVASLHPNVDRVFRDRGILYARYGDWAAAADAFARMAELRGLDTALVRRIRDDMPRAETRARVVREIAATGLSPAYADMLMAIGDKPGAVAAMETRAVRRGEFSHTFVIYVSNPELRAGPEYRRIMDAAGIPLR